MCSFIALFRSKLSCDIRSSRKSPLVLLCSQNNLSRRKTRVLRNSPLVLLSSRFRPVIFQTSRLRPAQLSSHYYVTKHFFGENVGYLTAQGVYIYFTCEISNLICEIIEEFPNYRWILRVISHVKLN